MMPPREERVATAASIRALLASGAEAQLRAIPGVTHVSVGLKERGHRASSDVAIRVYVKEKRAVDQLSAAERIPPEIEGVATDVIVSRAFKALLDVGKYRPVQGGIMITNRIIGANADNTDTGMGAGTYGCTVTLDNGKPGLLSCCHVLYAYAGADNSRIYQPGPTRWDRVPVENAPQLPHDDVDMIAKNYRGNITSKVDAAVAKLDVSSCCHCCGIEVSDEILGLSENGRPASDKILGVRAAVHGDHVVKVGANSGFSSGLVVDPTGDSFDLTFKGKTTTFVGQIYIAGDDGLFTFSYEGDSGSAIIGEDGFIVGLLFAGSDDPPPAFRAIANHIEDVIDELKITIKIAKPATTAGSRVAARELVYPEIDDGLGLYTAARTRLTSDPAGQWLWDIADHFREEIVGLVTTYRPVTVAWHRASGPAFFASGINAIRAGIDALPAPINGITFEEALERMGTSLAAHGSPELRATLQVHSAAILGAVHGSTTVTEVLQKLTPPVARA